MRSLLTAGRAKVAEPTTADEAAAAHGISAENIQALIIGGAMCGRCYRMWGDCGHAYCDACEGYVAAGRCTHHGQPKEEAK